MTITLPGPLLGWARRLGPVRRGDITVAEALRRVLAVGQEAVERDASLLQREEAE